MKNIALYLLIALEASLILAFSTDCNDVVWGTKTLYHPLQKIYTNPPQGYEPVFINYAGRHGARHLASITSDSIMFIVLKQAEKENGLTIAGKKLKYMDSLLLIIEKNNVGLISLKGQQEQEEIGRRMMQNFKSVFNDKNGSIKISTTKKERTKQSAKAFLKGLNPDDSHDITYDYNDKDNLAFYDVSPSYKLFKERGKWKESLAILKNTQEAKTTFEELTKQFFTTAFIKKLNSGNIEIYSKSNETYDQVRFIDAFYDACSIINSLQKEIAKAGFKPENIDFISLVPCSFLKELNYIHSAEDFLLKGPGLDNSGIQVKIAAPLLLSFLNSIDEYVSTKKVIADLRFAHAETIAPLAAILEIKNASYAESSDKIQDYNKIWKCEDIIPLSANIQFILYRNNKTGNLLVKLLLNEKEVTINGLQDSGTPYYYIWSDVRKYFYNKLEKLNIHTNDNMHDYLMNVN